MQVNEGSRSIRTNWPCHCEHFILNRLHQNAPEYQSGVWAQKKNRLLSQLPSKGSAQDSCVTKNEKRVIISPRDAFHCRCNQDQAAFSSQFVFWKRFLKIWYLLRRPVLQMHVRKKSQFLLIKLSVHKNKRHKKSSSSYKATPRSHRHKKPLKTQDSFHTRV